MQVPVIDHRIATPISDQLFPQSRANRTRAANTKASDCLGAIPKAIPDYASNGKQQEEHKAADEKGAREEAAHVCVAGELQESEREEECHHASASRVSGSPKRWTNMRAGVQIPNERREKGS